MAYLERENGRRVYFEDHGSGAQAVVLVHGWGMSVRTWDYNLHALLAAGHRVVLLDHRCCGQSDKDFSDVSIAAIAGDVADLVKQLGLSSVLLNGWSLGGAVVVEAAARLGAVCRGLALTCAASPAYLQKPDFPHGGTEEAMSATIAALTADRAGFLHALSQGICAVEVSEAMQRWLWQIFMDASPTAAASLAELASLDQRQQLAQLDMPILSFVGARDGVVDPEVCRSVARFNSRARLVEFPECGHAPHLEEPARYNDELLRFVAECL